jgi:hypothetical protein
MTLLQDAGIYVIQDLSNPSFSINRNEPEWTTDLFASYAAVIDEMAPYSNTLGFFAGNEVSNQKNNTAASAFVKAAVRDSKAYIKTKGYRAIGVGYATNDDAEIRLNLANYFNCGDASSAIDFWGYNIYSWCGNSNYVEAGYDQRTLEFNNYTVPAFFAEYGCNVPAPRKFTEVNAIYGKNMTDTWSGGIVYMYFQEANNYGKLHLTTCCMLALTCFLGLVKVSGSTVSKLADFGVLSSQIAQVSPKATASSAYVVTHTVARSCPTVNSDWAASSDLPPIANPQLCDCMVTSLGCVAKSGLSGKDISDTFDYICGQDNAACTGILANATTGAYGAYSMCSASQKLSFAMNQYYSHHSNAATACDFSGKAQTQTGTTSSACSPLVSQAGDAGTGTVTSFPSSAGTTGGAAAASSSTGAAGVLTIPRFDVGLMSLGIYVTAAMMAGAGIVLL